VNKNLPVVKEEKNLNKFENFYKINKKSGSTLGIFVKLQFL